jgi:hypothetical protein
MLGVRRLRDNLKSAGSQALRQSCAVARCFLTSGLRLCLLTTLLGLHWTALADTSGSKSKMNTPAKTGQNMQNPLYPQIQLPFSYNYNRRLGSNNGAEQTVLELNPIIPVSLGSDLQLILNPLLTYNRNANNPQNTNQYQPVQLATFFAPKQVGGLYAGIGPFIQLPASNATNGSRQTGLGFSAAVFYTPENWTFGVSMYNGWGVGSDLSGGTANILNVQPAITYTTNDAWTYSLQSQYENTYSAGGASNQLTLSLGRTIAVSGYQLQIQVGPTYMVTTSPSSAKGFGAFVGLTLVLPK